MRSKVRRAVSVFTMVAFLLALVATAKAQTPVTNTSSAAQQAQPKSATQQAQPKSSTPGAGINTNPVTAINTTDDLIQWMTYYYMHPQPDLLVPALKYADANGLVNKGQAPLTAFVSRVFAQNPTRIFGWVSELDNLSVDSKRMLWSALWWSNTIEGKQALDSLLKSLPEKQAEEVVAQMAKPAVPVDKMEITSPEVLDELWGAFSATGDEKYVLRLMSVLPWSAAIDTDYNKLTIGAAARWSLTSNAQQHPLVLKVCLREREKQPALKPMLDKVIRDATKPQTGSAQPAAAL